MTSWTGIPLPVEGQRTDCRVLDECRDGYLFHGLTSDTVAREQYGEAEHGGKNNVRNNIGWPYRRKPNRQPLTAVIVMAVLTVAFGIRLVVSYQRPLAPAEINSSGAVKSQFPKRPSLPLTTPPTSHHPAGVSAGCSAALTSTTAIVPLAPAAAVAAAATTLTTVAFLPPLLLAEFLFMCPAVSI
ncbi:hypothetical protein ColTof4_01373 [Colletotrichum tofieldiae]|nr:hypothetical protein ColTof3_08626 [Colletotrichum tofieldiae]GKT68950.1 hypothetical protein ColTof4_01373 [Colletotrichum tofieldiae]